MAGTTAIVCVLNAVCVVALAWIHSRARVETARIRAQAERRQK